MLRKVVSTSIDGSRTAPLGRVLGPAGSESRRHSSYCRVDWHSSHTELNIVINATAAVSSKLFFNVLLERRVSTCLFFAVTRCCPGSISSSTFYLVLASVLLYLHLYSCTSYILSSAAREECAARVCSKRRAYYVLRFQHRLRPRHVSQLGSITAPVKAYAWHSPVLSFGFSRKCQP